MGAGLWADTSKVSREQAWRMTSVLKAMQQTFHGSVKLRLNLFYLPGRWWEGRKQNQWKEANSMLTDCLHLAFPFYVLAWHSSFPFAYHFQEQALPVQTPQILLLFIVLFPYQLDTDLPSHLSSLSMNTEGAAWGAGEEGVFPLSQMLWLQGTFRLLYWHYKWMHTPCGFINDWTERWRGMKMNASYKKEKTNGK